MLYVIGIGLNDEKDISLKGLEIIKRCGTVYLENYTSKLNCSVQNLENLYGKKIILANRNLVEEKSDIILKAKKEDVAFLVAGDSLVATTHMDLMMRAKKEDVNIEVVNNASVITAVGITGLQVYKFGKITSIPFPQKSFQPESPYDILRENRSIGAHTLFLLDLKPEEKKFMTVKQAINYLLKIEKKRNEQVFTKDTVCVGCARLGSKDFFIKSGKARNLIKENFGSGLHCLIVPGKLHFMEKELLGL